jgi:anti-sigma regulatory factor (Ser/Thr protein kinase)
MRAIPAFSHEAFFYADDEEYLAGTVPFVQEGLDEGEPVLVAVPQRSMDLLASHFGTGHPGLQLVSMEAMGRNPAWIIPAWADFAGAHAAAGRPARGIGEPIWASRSPEELVECERHEALINLAFAGTDGFRLLCPYDTTSLPDPIVETAHRNHPHVTRPGATTLCARYDRDIPGYLSSPLSPVPADAEVVDFDVSHLAPIRARTSARAAAAGLPPAKVEDMVVAVSEAITNTARHGGGSGRLAIWRAGDRFICEVQDRGVVSDPLAGRVRPRVDQIGGRGLWLMHQLCDLVQMRVLADLQAIRLHMQP